MVSALVYKARAKKDQGWLGTGSRGGKLGKGAATRLSSLINTLYKYTKPRRHWRCFLVAGHTNTGTVWILNGSVSVCPLFNYKARVASGGHMHLRFPCLINEFSLLEMLKDQPDMLDVFLREKETRMSSR